MEREVEIPETSIIQVVLERLSNQGLPDNAISRFKDQIGIDHLKVDLSLSDYQNIQSPLKQDLQDAKASVVKIEEQQDELKKYFLWAVQRMETEKLSILFSCKREPLEKPEESAATGPTSKVALIMDDMGYSLDVLYDILSLQEPITVAIIPYSPLGEQTAQLAHQNGLEILMHLPLESINNEESYNDIQGMISTDMSEQEIITTMEMNLDQVPYISGVNNHMGSRVTPNETMMTTILQRLKPRGLFFVDSRTTGNSVAYDMALRLDIPTAQRNVFLDGELDEEYIKGKLIELFSLAQERGEAVGICHPMPETLNVLKSYFRLAEEYGVKPVFISDLVR
jgi:polysaccharide deacetylase 2 family uncharacterized protein YibQ